MALKSIPSFVDAAGGAAEGAYMTFGAVGGATGYDEFLTKFTEQFGDPIAYGPGSYDAAMIILNAAKAVATVDSDGNLVIPKKALADAVRAAPYDGITGHLEFDENGDLKVVSITVVPGPRRRAGSCKSLRFWSIKPSRGERSPLSISFGRMRYAKNN
jgi:ABC-type branched-subunit amino acid transport system substrate-binding protein